MVVEPPEAAGGSSVSPVKPPVPSTPPVVETEVLDAPPEPSGHMHMSPFLNPRTLFEGVNVPLRNLAF